MVNDIFEKGYFEKRRGEESQNKTKKGSISNFLSVKKKTTKNKSPKIKPSKSNDAFDMNTLQVEPEEVYMDEAPKKSKKSKTEKESRSFTEWKRDFVKGSVAGFSGGFVIFVFLLRYVLQYDPTGYDFWGGILLLVITALIVFSILSLLLRALDN